MSPMTSATGCRSFITDANGCDRLDFLQTLSTNSAIGDFADAIPRQVIPCLVLSVYRYRDVFQAALAMLGPLKTGKANSLPVSVFYL